MITSLRQQLQVDGSLTLHIRARPGARKTQFKETLADGSVKIDIAAAPEDDAANEELVRFLSEELRVPRSSIQILSGKTARLKIVRIQTLSKGA